MVDLIVVDHRLRQAPEVPVEAAQQVRCITVTRDETNGTLLITRVRNPGPQPKEQEWR